MKILKALPLLGLLLCTSQAFSQIFYVETFNGGFSGGWSATDGRIDLSSEVASSGYHSSAQSPEASGGDNVKFSLCAPSGPDLLYLNCAGVVNTTGKSNLRVGFGLRKTATFNRPVAFEFNADGAGWTLIDADVAAGAGGTWASRFYNLPASAAGASDLQFQFSFSSDANANCTAPQNFRIDDFSVGENASLPVTLTSFIPKPNPVSVDLFWTTATELNSDYFAVERSPNGSHFEEIALISGAGNTSTTQNYQFRDERPLQGINYYRLRQVDFDGKYAFSPVVAVHFGMGNRMNLLPTLATENIRMELEKEAETDGNWQVFDLNGRQLLSGAFSAESKRQSVWIGELPQGAYVLRLMLGQEVMVEQFWKR